MLLLAVPAFAGTAAAQEQPRVVRVPFHTINGLIVLDGKINGRPAVLLVDTGARPNFATDQAAGSKPHTGIKDAQIEITVGELRIVCPARIVPGLQSPKTDGTLGEDFLRNFSSVRIDYKAGVVEFEK